MSQVVRCAECGNSGIWRVTPMSEHRATSFGQMGYWDDIEPLETRICASCGHAVWYSNGFEGLQEKAGRVARVDDGRTLCDDCGGTHHWLVAQLLESGERSLTAWMPLHVVQTAQHDGQGRFALLVCAGCGRCQWFAWGTSALGGREHALPCRRCRAVGQRLVDPVREDGLHVIPVALHGQHPIGHFALSFCSACGLCDWYARGLESLSSDGKRVTFIDLDPERVDARATVAGGPYR